MEKITCPKCGSEITVDETTYSAILSQVRDAAFRAEVEEKARDASEKARYEQEKKSQKIISDKEKEINELNSELKKAELEKKLAVQSAQNDMSEKLQAAERRREKDIASTLDTKNQEIMRLNILVSEAEKRHQLELQQKDETIAFYRDLKTKLSTKMIGECLEQHCEQSFNMIRAAAFQGAYFEKDTTISDGTKGDYIFRDYDESGNEIISIMFEMKNEMDETGKKQKNADFFKKLDSDRVKKGCEYAVLVSMLEIDNDVYNQGIVDVSHRYPKMYVIRPQFFIPFITFLRNESRKTLSLRRALEDAKSKNVDIQNFSNAIDEFKQRFSKNCTLAYDQYNDAIDQINKSISALEKTRDKLISSMRNLSSAEEKAENLSITKLCKNSKSLLTVFAASTGNQ